MPGSIASLSRLSSLTGRGTGADEYDDGQIEDLLQAQTGLNWSGRRELALADLADHLDELDFKKQQRRETIRRADAGWLGPEGWARNTPDEAQHARDLNFGDARADHDLQRDMAKIRGEGKARSDVYWEPGTQSMLEDQARRTERLNTSRYVDPVLARSDSAEEIARINAQARTGAAGITAAGRSGDVLTKGLMDQLTALVKRGDVDPNDPAAMMSAVQNFLSSRGAAVPGGTGAGSAGSAGGGMPDLSGLQPGHGRTFSSGPFSGQTWTIDAQGNPSRVK